MYLQKLIANYTAYNEWANIKMIEWLDNIDPIVLITETPSSYKSIDLTLQHILRAQKFWQLFIQQQDYSDFDWSVRTDETKIILQELKEVSTDMKINFSLFTEIELTEYLLLNTKWAKNSLYRYEYIMHIINHSNYHRGQIITMARTLNITTNIPNTDYNMFNTILM